jgi:hypothetical protein
VTAVPDTHTARSNDMADCMAALIEIGGDLPRNHLEELVERIHDSGAGFDWIDHANPEAIRTRLAAAAAEGATLDLTDDQARWGRFERLEEWLVEHSLPWRRHTSAKYEYDAEIVWFAPGMTAPESVPANEGADVLVPLDEVRRILDRSLAEPMAPALRSLVDRYTVPDVPPLRIVEMGTTYR